MPKRLDRQLIYFGGEYRDKSNISRVAAHSETQLIGN